MIGKLRVSSYEKKGDKWELSDSNVEDGNLELKRWKEWKNFDKGLGSTVFMESEGNTLKRYVTYSPDKKKKVIYSKVSD